MESKQINSTYFTNSECFEDEFYIQLQNPNQLSRDDICQVEDTYFEYYNRRYNKIMFYFIHIIMYYITIVLFLTYVFEIFYKFTFKRYLERGKNFSYENSDSEDEQVNEDIIIKQREYINDKYGENQVKMEMNELETKVFLQDENDDYNLIITKDIGTNTYKEDIIPAWCDSSEEYFKCRLEKLLENTRIAIPVNSFCSIYGHISQLIPKDATFLELDNDTVSNATIVNMLKEICSKRGWNNKFLITDNNY